jgi:hypothetical protein
VLYTPVGEVVVARRILLMLPGDSPYVNVAEALVFALLALVGPAFVFVNMSPPGELLRFLVTNTFGDPPKVIRVGEAVIERCQLGSRKGMSAARSMTLEDVEPLAGPFLMRALRGTAALLGHGRYVRADGTPPPPCFSDSGGYSFAALYEALALSCSHTVGSAPKAEHSVSLWCNACSCPHKEILCKHILFLRLYHVLELQRAPLWSDCEERLYAAMAQRGVVIAVAPELPKMPAPPPRTPSSVVDDASITLAELAHLFAAAAALASGDNRAAQGSMERALRSVHAAASVLRRSVGVAEAVSGSRGGAPNLAASERDPDKIDAVRRAATPVAMSALPPIDALRRTLMLTRGDDGGDDAGSGAGGGSLARPDLPGVAARAHFSMAETLLKLDAADRGRDGAPAAVAAAAQGRKRRAAAAFPAGGGAADGGGGGGDDGGMGDA